MRQLCAQLDDLASPVMRTAIELAIDTVRRPEELCALGFDCLARDDDGLPVLVYDNHKANRLGRRLPISENTAELITNQREHVRARWPHTPLAPGTPPTVSRLKERWPSSRPRPPARRSRSR